MGGLKHSLNKSNPQPLKIPIRVTQAYLIYRATTVCAKKKKSITPSPWLMEGTAYLGYGSKRPNKLELKARMRT